MVIPCPAVGGCHRIPNAFQKAWTLQSLSVSTFQLSSVQAAAVAELLRIAPVADRLGELFSNAGHELYLVGGSVRDALLGRLGHDLDFATSARPDAVEKLLRKLSPAVDHRQGVRHHRLQGRCRRRELGHRDHHVPLRDVYPGTAESRRSRSATRWTMISAPRFHDQCHGGVNSRQEVRRPVRRADRSGTAVDSDPATPESSFSDDPLRMMRAARFVAQLGFRPAPEVVAAMRDMADRISIISAERIRDELKKLLLTDRPRPGLDLLVSTGLAARCCRSCRCGWNGRTSPA